MTEPDAVLVRMGQAMRLGQAGDRQAARAMFSEIWNDLGGEAGDPLHRCAVAHAMADVQDDPRRELVWDLRALQAADSISDERAARAGATTPVAGFYPSLHLNLAECYRKLGDLDRAREHVSHGRDLLGALADDGYGQQIRDGLAALEQRLSLT
jgi:hypothetical protein